LYGGKSWAIFPQFSSRCAANPSSFLDKVDLNKAVISPATLREIHPTESRFEAGRMGAVEWVISGPDASDPALFDLASRCNLQSDLKNAAQFLFALMEKTKLIAAHRLYEM
jgi:hypothetical protein